LKELIIMATWQVQQAKTKLSELIEDATTKGPQIITRHGKERAVILSIAKYRRLTASKPDLRALLLGGPKVDSFEIERETDTGREIDL
jgi:antitoxin Phd